MPRATGRAVPAVLLAAVLSACGGTAGGDHDMGAHQDGRPAGMTMGDPDAVPAGQVPGAERTSGTFRLLDTAPEGYSHVAGTATMARYDGGTTVTVELTGLKPDAEFISHVHNGSCADGGGAHYKFDPAGGDKPPNEIHLSFTSTAEGTGYMTAENDRTAGPQARSVVIHPREFTDNRIACASLS